jgi:hypothetical protein
LGLKQTRRKGDLEIETSRYASIIGERSQIGGELAFKQKDSSEGVLLHGPYMHLEPGLYELSLTVGFESGERGALSRSALVIDMISDLAARTWFAEGFGSASFTTPRRLIQRVEVTETAENVEIRATVRGPRAWTVSVPELRKIPG